MKYFVFFVLFLSITPIWANECKVNGCGSGWNEILVPDKVSLLKIDFTNSCAAHDRCYSECIQKCTHYSGKKNCDEHWKIKRKAECDDTFLANMYTSCTHSFKWVRELCEELAVTYFTAVSRLGWSSFFGIELPSGGSIAAEKPKDILSHEIQKYYLDKQHSDLIEAIKRSPFGKGKELDKLFMNKELKPQGEIIMENKLPEIFMNNERQLNQILKKQEGHKYILPQNLPFSTSEVERLEMEQAVNQIMNTK